MKIDCIICGKNNLNKNTIGINKKSIGRRHGEFLLYGLPCRISWVYC